MAKKIDGGTVVIKATDDGSLKDVGNKAKKAGKGFKELGKGSRQADRAMKGVAQMSSGSSKNFSKLQQGITGGLVPAYATLAANLFALDAAFRFLKDAADFRVLQQGQLAFAATTGTAYKALARDLMEATDNMITFKDAAQAGAIGIAAGMTIGGKIPFTGTFANFSTSRVYDQIRQSVAYSDKNVKICASHAGVTLGEDGATHQVLEDIGMMKMLPNMVVINPCDYNQTKAATIAIADYDGPIYLRFGRPKVPNFTPKNQAFEIGKAINLQEGTDITIVATGHLVWEALEAAKTLINEGISVEVINIHTIKPLDEKAILNSVSKTKCIVTAEEHMLNGGLGDSIAQLLSRNSPTPLEMVGVNDSFGESGSPMKLLEKYGLDAKAIVAATKKVITRKETKHI